ncbi:TPA: hypothetical protein ACQVJ5_001941 [Serratia marcescens]|uniref:hypothetical protein n=1 Tax=Serratia TaxID=613 RepID=UPI001E3184D4|nr:MULTISPECIES: hypothetical protein [Serratia]MDK5930266.1 hypothetical protein [Serratia nevei]
MDYHNVFQLTYQERNELFSALDKIADDPAGGDAYIHAIRTAMNTHLPHRLSAVLSPKKASFTLRSYRISRNVPVDKDVFFSFSRTKTRLPSMKKIRRCAGCNASSFRQACGITATSIRLKSAFSRFKVIIHA